MGARNVILCRPGSMLVLRCWGPVEPVLGLGWRRKGLVWLQGFLKLGKAPELRNPCHGLSVAAAWHS